MQCFSVFLLHTFLIYRAYSKRKFPFHFNHFYLLLNCMDTCSDGYFDRLLAFRYSLLHMSHCHIFYKKFETEEKRQFKKLSSQHTGFTTSTDDVMKVLSFFFVDAALASIKCHLIFISFLQC